MLSEKTMTKTLVATAAGVIFLCANRKIRAYVEVIKVEVFYFT